VVADAPVEPAMVPPVADVAEVLAPLAVPPVAAVVEVPVEAPFVPLVALFIDVDEPAPVEPFACTTPVVPEFESAHPTTRAPASGTTPMPIETMTPRSMAYPLPFVDLMEFLLDPTAPLGPRRLGRATSH
jgi:hypothetical protein